MAGRGDMRPLTPRRSYSAWNSLRLASQIAFHLCIEGWEQKRRDTKMNFKAVETELILEVEERKPEPRGVEERKDEEKLQGVVLLEGETKE